MTFASVAAGVFSEWLRVRVATGGWYWYHSALMSRAELPLNLKAESHGGLRASLLPRLGTEPNLATQVTIIIDINW